MQDDEAIRPSSIPTLAAPLSIPLVKAETERRGAPERTRVGGSRRPVLKRRCLGSRRQWGFVEGLSLSPPAFDWLKQRPSAEERLSEPVPDEADDQILELTSCGDRRAKFTSFSKGAQCKTTSVEFHAAEFCAMIARSLVELVHSRLLPMLEDVTASGGGGGPIDLHDVLLRLTFDNVCMIAFGIDLGCRRSPSPRPSRTPRRPPSSASSRPPPSGEPCTTSTSAARGGSNDRCNG
ncbi:Cytochrome P450 [Canna indica]|uniref:Cytochrome P450 n=1 Tax=Canna indica TaxID=4628 RepID=A0AAQ3KN86_9LILI|nr:Cytochrome P450 [Canna indica]